MPNFCRPTLRQFKILYKNKLILYLGVKNSTTHLTLVHVLLRCRENRNFHRLLAGLAIVDTVLIVILVLEMSVVGVFMKKEPLWYIISYPYIIHPGRGIVQVSLHCTVH